MMRVLVSDPMAEEGLKFLKQEKELSVDVKQKLAPEELKRIIADYEAIIVRSETKLTKDVIEAALKLKVVGRAGVGLDNVDVAAASKKGVIVMNTPAGNTISTAEHAMSLILSLSRNIPQADHSLKSGEWDRKRFMGVELFGKTLGIVGLGRIGREVARRAASFGMHVIAFDPYLASEKGKELEVELVPFEDLISRADYITVHTPLSDETRHMIGKKEIDRMKAGVRIINCARGGVVEEAALCEALKSGKVAGAALDVFEKEPPKDNPLLQLPNIVVTPHLGASTEEAQVNVSIEIARQVADALLGRGIRSAVNTPSLDPEVYKILKPFIVLAEKLGSLQAQLLPGAIDQVKIRYSGDIINHDLAPLTIALIKGLLTPALHETVNYVNATFLAKERGISVVESKSSQIEEFANAIGCEVSTQKERSEVLGTLFSKNDPRIVKINQFYVDAVPQGNMIITTNQDKPGIIGNIGTILGKHGVNIAGMTFGRVSPGGDAITVLNVDSEPPAKALDEIRKAPHILGVRTIKL